jgi:outer membrane protein assembly factor BamB
MQNFFRRTLLFSTCLVTLFVILAGCSLFEEAPKVAIDKSKRLSVLQLEKKLAPESNSPVVLQDAATNANWTQAGGSATHALPTPPALAKTLNVAWKSSIGSSNAEEGFTPIAPLVTENKVIALNTTGVLTALNTLDGETLWETSLAPVNKDDVTLLRGGMAASEGIVYIATGYAELLAVDVNTGKILWRSPLPAPVHATPTIEGNKLFLVTVDNEIYAYGLPTGTLLWNSAGLSETTAIAGTGSVAADNDLVVVPYSSGELTGVLNNNGRTVWEQSLSAASRLSAAASLSSIVGRPIIHNGNVFAVGHGNRMIAVDARSGKRLWSKDIGSIHSPWLAGGLAGGLASDYLYVVTNTSQLLCLGTDGAIRWVLQLQRFEDGEEKKDPITWSSPIIGGNRLLLTNSLGQLVSVSPLTGAILGTEELPAPTIADPVIARGTLYLLTNEGDVVAMR